MVPHWTIHAAGIYGTNRGDIVADYVVLSYTPTLKALLTRPSSRSTASTNPFKMLVVIQPETKGQSPLPHAADELLRIAEHVPSKCLVKLGTPDAPAFVQTVLSHLSTSSIVHLACHGLQNANRPLDSVLVLEDGQKSKVTRIMEDFTPNASLAFLSTCQTATGDENLPDEAIHIAASLLFAGFRGVVATMW